MIKNLNRKVMLKDLLADNEWELQHADLNGYSDVEVHYLKKTIEHHKRELALLEEKTV